MYCRRFENECKAILIASMEKKNKIKNCLSNIFKITLKPEKKNLYKNRHTYVWRAEVSYSNFN